MWHDVKIKLPDLKEKDYSLGVSRKVLLCLSPCVSTDNYCIARLEKWSDEEPARWFTVESERWDVTEQAKFWQELPEFRIGEVV